MSGERAPDGGSGALGEGRGRIDAWLVILAAWQTAHFGRFLLVALISVALSGAMAGRLELHTAFGELLPENKESVIVADEVNERLPAISTLTVVVEGSDDEGLKRFVDALAPKIEAIGPPLVGRVDRGVQAARQFFEDYAFLYAERELVEDVAAQIDERYEYEIAKRAGTWFDDDYVPPPLTEESLRERLLARARGETDEDEPQKKGTSPEDDPAPKSKTMPKTAFAEAEARYPDGYYLDPKSHTIVLNVLTPVRPGDIEQSEQLQEAVARAVAETDLRSFDPTAKVGYGGNLLTSAETYQQIKDDLAHVGVWGVSLILGIVFLYYLRLRTVVAMTLTVGIGASWTFGLAELLIGHLNSSTGFLFSIVVGNGINFGIIYMARYLEARRTEDAPASLLIAHRQTWLSTLTAAGAATAAYGSLAVTDFRGFKHFGLIGGTGMLLCWLATYLFLPAILTASERLSPIVPPKGIVAKLRGLYGRPFAFLAGRYPRAVLLVAMAITVVSSVLACRYVVADPMEYNMRMIANDPADQPSEARRLGKVADKIVGRRGQDGLAIATDRLDQVLPLKAALERRWAEAPEGNKPFEKVVTIHSLLPEEQEDKLATVKATRAKLERAHERGFLSDEQWAKIDALLPAERMRTIGIDDLPEQVARSFTEKDGTRGRLVYIVPTKGRSVWDGKYLIEWADSFRRTELPDGSVVKGSGRSVIFADVIMAIIEDAPKAIIASVLFTLLIVLVAFRGSLAGVGVLLSVLVGLLWTVGILAVWNTSWPEGSLRELELAPLKLNFLNFVALPITVGVGADYAVNVMQRYRLAGQMERAVVETGGAVVLCSLTTMLGYSALTASANRAIRSFGVAAAAGEICCVITGVLVLPAFLLWWSRRRATEAS